MLPYCQSYKRIFFTIYLASYRKLKLTRYKRVSISYFKGRKFGENWLYCKVNGFLVLHKLNFQRQNEDYIVIVGKRKCSPCLAKSSTLNYFNKEPYFIHNTDRCLGTPVPLNHPWQFWPNSYWFVGLYTDAPIIKSLTTIK